MRQEELKHLEAQKPQAGDFHCPKWDGKSKLKTYTEHNTELS